MCICIYIFSLCSFYEIISLIKFSLIWINISRGKFMKIQYPTLKEDKKWVFLKKSCISKNKASIYVTHICWPTKVIWPWATILKQFGNPVHWPRERGESKRVGHLCVPFPRKYCAVSNFHKFTKFCEFSSEALCSKKFLCNFQNLWN